MSAGVEPGPGLLLVDTHAHLVDDRLRDQVAAVLVRARAAGVGQVIAVGTTAPDSAQGLTLARAHPGVFATAGIHPNHWAEAEPGAWDQLLPLLDDPLVVAIGETGLDRHWDHTPFSAQQAAFDRHLALARDRDLPIIIHCREAEADVVAQLERFGPPIRGVLHSFTGSWDQAEAFLGLGLDLSFAGMLTFTSKGLDPLRLAASRAPADRILVETDSPYLSPHPFRGQTNEPARVALTAERLASLRGVRPEALARITTANARRLFRLPEAPTLRAV